MTSNHAELFNTFLEAGKAMEELPIVRSDLVKAKIELDQVKTAYEDAQLDVMERDETIAKLHKMLDAREAELASATFREAEVQATLDGVRKLLGSGNADVASASNPVMGQPQAVGMDFGTKDSTAYATVENGVITSVTITTGAAFDGSEPRDHADLDPTNDGLGWARPKEDPTPAPLSGPDSQATTYGVVDEAGRFVSHDPEPEVAPQPEPVRPFLDRPHWQKPSSLSWSEWVNGGGEKPYWLTDKDLAVDF